MFCFDGLITSLHKYKPEFILSISLISFLSGDRGCRGSFFSLCIKVNLAVNGVCCCRKAHLFILIIRAAQTTEPSTSFQVRMEGRFIEHILWAGPPVRHGPAERERKPLACVSTLTLLAAAPGKEINLCLPSGREWGCSMLSEFSFSGGGPGPQQWVDWGGQSYSSDGSGTGIPGGREVGEYFLCFAFFLGSSAGQWWGRIAEHAASASGSLWIAVEKLLLTFYLFPNFFCKFFPTPAPSFLSRHHWWNSPQSEEANPALQCYQGAWKPPEGLTLHGRATWVTSQCTSARNRLKLIMVELEVETCPLDRKPCLLVGERVADWDKNYSMVRWSGEQINKTLDPS